MLLVGKFSVYNPPRFIPISGPIYITRQYTITHQRDFIWAIATIFHSWGSDRLC